MGYLTSPLRPQNSILNFRRKISSFAENSSSFWNSSQCFILTVFQGVEFYLTSLESEFDELKHKRLLKINNKLYTTHEVNGIEWDS